MRNPEAMILDLAADDYTGLWELVWGAQAETPEVEAATIHESLLAALAELIASGKVRLYRGTRFSGDEKAVSTGEALELLSRAESWEPPDANAMHLRVLTEE